ncbi:MAG: FAD-dependent thymidylate synthase [Candidatus Woesearchaeota archaeon]
MVDVRLVGFDVSKDSLDEIISIGKGVLEREGEMWLPRERERAYRQAIKEMLEMVGSLTPEVLSAGFARISRDPRPVPEILKDARNNVAAARKSNTAIIHGMGHKSIAEHAPVSFAIMGLSRHAVEAVEQARLASFTERSQRYTTTDGNYVVPEEIRGTEFEADFHRVAALQNSFYQKVFPQLVEWHRQRDYSELFKALGCSDNPEKQATVIENLGKEDARYVLPLATKVQLGMTTNGRLLETMITRLRSSRIAEQREIGEKLNELVDGIAPSVIKYTEPTDYFTKTRPGLEEYVRALCKQHGFTPDFSDRNKPLTEFQQFSDNNVPVLAGLLFAHSNMGLQQCQSLIDILLCSDPKALEKLDTLAKRHRTVHDPLLREYELRYPVQLVLSSSAFAQLKRHRMCTLIAQAYDPRLGTTVPQSIVATRNGMGFLNVMSESEALYWILKADPRTTHIADYILTNAHRRRVLLDANLREQSVISTERENLAAQWDIRLIAKLLHAYTTGKFPILSRGMCGKHEYEAMHRHLLQEE